MKEDALRLRDIHLPPEPAIWPLAPGWWWVMAIIILAALISLALYRWLLPLLKAKRQVRRRERIWRDEVNSITEHRLRLQAAIEVARRFSLMDEPGLSESEGFDWIDRLSAREPNEPPAESDIQRLRSLPYQKQPADAEILPLIERLHMLAVTRASK